MKKLIAFILIIAILAGGVFFLWRSYTVPGEEDFLFYVGASKPLPKSYEPELTELSNGQKVSSEMYPALQKMFDDMRAEGIYPIVRSGYRSYEEQQELIDVRIDYLTGEGYSYDEALTEIYKWVAKPGESEHQLGLGVDINEKEGYSTEKQVYNWLSKNAYKYGFICRYPSDKVDITGISNEPWHYRYVGKAAAKEMYESGQCLEEYLEENDFMYRLMKLMHN